MRKRELLKRQDVLLTPHIQEDAREYHDEADSQLASPSSFYAQKKRKMEALLNKLECLNLKIIDSSATSLHMQPKR